MWQAMSAAGTLIFLNTGAYPARMKDHRDEFTRTDPIGLLNMQ